MRRLHVQSRLRVRGTRSHSPGAGVSSRCRVRVPGRAEPEGRDALPALVPARGRSPTLGFSLPVRRRDAGGAQGSHGRSPGQDLGFSGLPGSDQAPGAGVSTAAGQVFQEALKTRSLGVCSSLRHLAQHRPRVAVRVYPVSLLSNSFSPRSPSCGPCMLAEVPAVAEGCPASRLPKAFHRCGLSCAEGG